jgi:hypothetical protein
MSTKIYDGYVINEVLTTYQLKLIFKKIKQQVDRIAIELFKSKYAKVACTYLDDVMTGYIKPKDNKSPSFYAFEKQLDAHKKINNDLRSPDWDFSVIMFIYPLKNKTLFIINTEHNELLNIILKICPKIKYYGYWNNTDPSKDCSKEEWRQRENDWNKVFDESIYPIGMRIILDEYKCSIPVNLEIISLVPNFEDRVNYQVKNHLIVKRIRYIRKKEKIKLKNNEEMNRICMESFWWLQEGIEKKDVRFLRIFNKEKERISKILKKNLTIEDISNDI